MADTAILKTVKSLYLGNKSPITMIFGMVTHVVPINFTMPGHTLHVLFYIINCKKNIL